MAAERNRPGTEGVLTNQPLRPSVRPRGLHSSDQHWPVNRRDGNEFGQQRACIGLGVGYERMKEDEI